MACSFCPPSSRRRPESCYRFTAGRRPGPPVHDDLLERQFTAPAQNMRWNIADLMEGSVVEEAKVKALFGRAPYPTIVQALGGA